MDKMILVEPYCLELQIFKRRTYIFAMKKMCFTQTFLSAKHVFYGVPWNCSSSLLATYNVFYDVLRDPCAVISFYETIRNKNYIRIAYMLCKLKIGISD